jgi:hypothetical protein
MANSIAKPSTPYSKVHSFLNRHKESLYPVNEIAVTLGLTNEQVQKALEQLSSEKKAFMNELECWSAKDYWSEELKEMSPYAGVERLGDPIQEVFNNTMREHIEENKGKEKKPVTIKDIWTLEDFTE